MKVEERAETPLFLISFCWVYFHLLVFYSEESNKLKGFEALAQRVVFKIRLGQTSKDGLG